MKIINITIVQGRGPDAVFLDTELPSPCPNFDTHELSVKFDAAADSGEQYVLTNFPGVPYKIIPRPVNTYHFGKQYENHRHV